MSISLFHRREHLFQLGISAGAFGLPISSLSVPLANRPEAESAIKKLFAKLNTGRKYGPGRNNAYAIIEADNRENLYVQALVPPTRQCIWLEAVSAINVKNWQKIMTPGKLTILAALGFQDPGPRSPNYWQEIPRADARSTDLAAKIAAFALYEVYSAKNLKKAKIKLSLPGKPIAVSTLGSVNTLEQSCGDKASSETGIKSPRKRVSIPQHPNIVEAPPEKYGFAIGISAARPPRQPAPKMTASEPKYGYLDDCAVRFTDTEAWLFAKGEWQRINSGEAVGGAVLLSKTEYDEMFADDQLPDLPAVAFKSADKPS